MGNYEFFFSYTRDDWDNFMQDFFTDLKREIARKTPRNEDDDFAFQDQGEIVLGQNWRPRLLDGMQNSAVLVPVYTPRYFNSEWCGREIEFFQRRMNQPAAAQFTYPCIIPVIWDIEEENIAQSVAAITFKDDSLPPEYAGEGMLRLTRLKSGRHRDAYWSALEAIAEAIVRAAKQKLPALAQAPGFAQLDQIQNAFNPVVVGVAPGVPPSIAPDPPPGPGSVQFFYIAARSTELQQASKNSIDFYHPGGGEFWRPCINGQRLAAFAAAVAGSKELDLVAFNQPLDQLLVQRLQTARDNNNLVVLFADAWSIRLLASYRQHATLYDQNAFFNSCLLVVWNEEDPDLDEPARDDLRRSLVQVLRTASTRQEPYYISEIVGELNLQLQLRKGLERLMHKIAETGQTNQPPEKMPRPVLPVNSGGN